MKGVSRDRSPEMLRRVGHTHLLTFQIVAVMVLLMTAEGFARGWYLLRNRIPFWETSVENVDRIYDYTHPYLPVVLRKHSRLLRTTDIFINNVGFRGPNVSAPKLPGSLRIAALGGSTTWGPDVSDQDTWPRIIEAELRTRFPDRRIEVINAGVPGYNSMEDLINLAAKVLPLQPDFVLLYQGYNDMKASSRAVTFEPDYSDWRSRKNPHNNLGEILTNNSRLLFGLDNLASRFIKRKRTNYNESRFVDHGQLASYKRNLYNTVAVCRAHDIIPILSTVHLALNSRFVDEPSSVMMAPSEFKVMLQAYNSQVLDIAAERDVELVDAGKELADDGSIHTDICHFTVAGNRKLAGLFVERIVSILHRRRLTDEADSNSKSQASVTDRFAPREAH